MSAAAANAQTPPGSLPPGRIVALQTLPRRDDVAELTTPPNGCSPLTAGTVEISHEALLTA